MKVRRKRCHGERWRVWGTLKDVAHGRGVSEPQTQNHLHSPACVLNSLNPVRKRIRFFSSTVQSGLKSKPRCSQSRRKGTGFSRV